MNPTETFAERLKAERNKKGFTQSKLAEIAGVSTQTISSYEKGGKSPTLDNAAEIAKALGVSLDYLAGTAEKTEVKMQFDNLSDVIVAINNLGDYFYCSFGTEEIQLDPDYWTEIANPDGGSILIDTARIAILKIHNETLAHFFDSNEKLLRLKTENTISEEMYNTWLSGELQKLKKYQISNDDVPF